MTGEISQKSSPRVSVSQMRAPERVRAPQAFPFGTESWLAIAHRSLQEQGPKARPCSTRVLTQRSCSTPGCCSCRCKAQSSCSEELPCPSERRLSDKDKVLPGGRRALSY